MITEAIASLSAATMPMLWVAIFMFARRRRAAWENIAFYLGTFVISPVVAASFGLFLTGSVPVNIDRGFSPWALLLFGFTFAVTLFVWFAGYAIASIIGRFFEKQIDRKAILARR